jgi:hypothetical protein
MQNPALMRVMHGPGQLLKQLRRRPIRHGRFEFRDVRRQGTALNELHTEEWLPLALADFVDGHDIRMIQAGRSFGFRAKPRYEVRRSKLSRRQDLQRHDPAHLRLSRLVDDAHAATSHLFDQFVAGKRSGHARPAGGPGERTAQRPAIEHSTQKTLRAETLEPITGQGASTLRTGRGRRAGQIWH